LEDEKLVTELPPEEALKPLRRIVLDLAEKKKTVPVTSRRCLVAGCNSAHE
jgi:hypothetical protein